MPAGNVVDNQIVGNPTGHNQIAGTQPIANIATLRALTSAQTFSAGAIIFVDGWATPLDGGQSPFQYVSTDTTSADNAATIFVDALNRRWYRVWDGVNFQAAWAGIVPGVADIAPLMGNVPKFAYCFGIPGQIYTVASPPTIQAVSNVYWRFASCIFNSTVAFADFDLTAILFNWVNVSPPAIQNLNYADGGNSGDMTSAGLSPFEGMGIVSQGDGNSGVGVALGEPIPTSPKGGARSTTSHTTGKVQFEITINNIIGGAITLGFSSSGYNLTTGLEFSPLSLGVNSLGQVYINSSHIATIDAFSTGINTYSFVLDFDNQLLWGDNVTTNPTQWNANGTANPATGIGGISFSGLASSTAYFVTTDLSATTPPGQQVTGNFGATTFAKPVAGVAAWGSGATFNPADEAGLTFSNGNLTTTNNSVNNSIEGSNYPFTYYTRPQNFSAGGFYVNLGYTIPFNTFLSGPKAVVLKRGLIGMYYNNNASGSSNSGENMVATQCNFNGMISDGVQLFSGQKWTYNGPCSFTYCGRMGYSSNQPTDHVDTYIETAGASSTNPTKTVREIWAVDGGTTVTWGANVTMTLGADGDGWPNTDLIAYYPGSGGYGQCFFEGSSICNFGGLQYNPGNAFLNNTPNLNLYGHIKGFNGLNFQPALSANQLLQPDFQFASGGLTFYPSSTNATVCIPAAGTASFTVNPTNGQTISIAGTTITFVASGATGNQVNIGGSLGTTFLSLIEFLQASADTNLLKCLYAQAQDSWGEFNSTELLIYASTYGTGGNSLALASTVTGITLSGAVLSGGAGTAGTAFGYDFNGVVYNNSIRIGAGISAVALASVNGTSVLQTAQWDVNPGEQINICFWDMIPSGGPGFTSFTGSVATFYTADGVQIGTPVAFSQFASIANFFPGTNHLSPNWGAGGGHVWTIERMVFRVPPGASKMSATITATSTGTGSNYFVTNFAVYSNRRP